MTWDLPTIQEQIQNSISWFEANHEKLAIAKAEFEAKKDFVKTQLAMCEIEEKAVGDPQAEVERKGRACDKYREFLVELDKARVDYLKLNTQWDAKMAAFEGLRSLNKNLQ